MAQQLDEAAGRGARHQVGGQVVHVAVGDVTGARHVDVRHVQLRVGEVLEQSVGSS